MNNDQKEVSKPIRVPSQEPLPTPPEPRILPLTVPTPLSPLPPSPQPKILPETIQPLEPRLDE